MSKVLIVDDSATIRKSAQMILNNEGFDVQTADDGFSAFAKIASFQPDIIFLDVMMPRIDGYELCSVVKSNPEFESTPIVMLTSKDTIFDKAKGEMAGANQFMTKPFSKEDLLNTINLYLK